jgi:nicotinate-nucleotide adenylyltransferase
MTQGENQRKVASPNSARRVAFFGGSFDPPHLGHLAVARAAKEALGLDLVLFAPVGVQPLKSAGSAASFEERVEMTRLAIADEDSFEVSLADAPQQDGRPNYSWDTLLRLRHFFAAESRIFFLMGADSFAGLRQWFRGADLPFLAPFIVASRPGERLDNLCALLPDGLTLEPGSTAEEAPFDAPSRHGLQSFVLRNPAGEIAPFRLLPELMVELSATQIRRELSGGDRGHVQQLLTAPVSEFIFTRKLYR